jgi:NADH-quinone oxidoreductase subunit L
MFLNHIYLIPLFPAFGAAMMFFFGRRSQKSTVNAVCVGAVVIAFLFACFTVVEYTHYAHGTGQPFQKIVYTWLGSGDSHFNFVKKDGTTAQINADAGFLLDPLSSIWLLFVTGVGVE